MNAAGTLTPPPGSDWHAAWDLALRSADAAVPPGLRAWNGSDVAARFAVHRRSVIGPLAEALAQSFPVLQTLLGEACFSEIGRAHV